MTEPAPPEGFRLHSRASPMTQPWMPIYKCTNARSIYLGVWLKEKHCNSRGLVHGGFIAALADNTMGYTCGQALKADGRPISGLVTISLNVDYLGSAKLGQWMSWEPELLKAGSSIAFASALIKANGENVARANASFKITK